MASDSLKQSGQEALQPLSETEMSQVSGQNIGVVLEDFTFSHGTNADSGQLFEIGGITTSGGDPVKLTVNQLYITGPDSQYGQNLGPVNLGRLNNPYRIALLDGDDPDVTVPGQAVVEFAAPSKLTDGSGFDCLSRGAAAGSGSCSSRPATEDFVGERPDRGLALQADAGGSTHHLNIHARSAVMDGSSIRLWGDQDLNQLAGQIQLNFYTPELTINACDDAGGNCAGAIRLTDLAMELSLGNRHQPLLLSVHGTEAEADRAGNLNVRIATIRQPAPGEIAADGSRSGSDTAAWDFYEDYYTNPEFRSDITLGNMQVGDRNFGGARLEGMLIQHLDVTTRDLNP
ncbi:MAG: hypothetical protein R3296_14700 [Oleiphilaceae bacterium]|nr:hypothetical protein [Oleiphilaceae bacterium]